MTLVVRCKGSSSPRADRREGARWRRLTAPIRIPLAAARHMGYGNAMSSLLLSASTARTGPASALALILGGLLLLRLART